MRRPRLRRLGARRAMSLISALMGVFILTSALAIVLQSYMVASRSLRLSEQRDAAMLALSAQLETLRAGGYGRLPAYGEYPIPASALPTLEDASGELAIRPGPAPDTREIAVTVTWTERGQREEHLAMVMAKQGMSP